MTRKLFNRGRSIALTAGPRTDPILLRTTQTGAETMTKRCEVLQGETVIATTERYLAAEDIVDAMRAFFPFILFSWRWEE
jgi:hypothetical protein